MDYDYWIYSIRVSQDCIGSLSLHGIHLLCCLLPLFRLKRFLPWVCEISRSPRALFTGYMYRFHLTFFVLYFVTGIFYVRHSFTNIPVFYIIYLQLMIDFHFDTFVWLIKKRGFDRVVNNQFGQKIRHQLTTVDSWTFENRSYRFTSNSPHFEVSSTCTCKFVHTNRVFQDISLSYKYMYKCGRQRVIGDMHIETMETTSKNVLHRDPWQL